MSKRTDPVWAEKYRPYKIDEVILPQRFKEPFFSYRDEDSLPNLLLSGPPGCGKTTVAQALLTEMGIDYFKINASLDGSKDMLRNEITNYATTMAIGGGRKCVLLDEADALSTQVQDSLRTFMEEFSKNCAFVLTCNHKNKISSALQSRTSLIEFSFSPEERKEMSREFFKRLGKICKSEGIEPDKEALVHLIKKHFPDMRRAIGELQKNVVEGKIQETVYRDPASETINELYSAMREKSFSKIRDWVSKCESEEAEVYSKLFERAEKNVSKKSLPEMVVILARYQYQAAFALDREINMTACFVELAAELEFL